MIPVTICWLLAAVPVVASGVRWWDIDTGEYISNYEIFHSREGSGLQRRTGQAHRGTREDLRCLRPLVRVAPEVEELLGAGAFLQ